MRLGKVKIEVSYVVDLDSQNRVRNATESVVEDVHNAVKYGEVGQMVELVKDDKGLSEDDIPESLKELEEI